MKKLLVNAFLENTNLQRGFIRLLVISSIGFFSWGAYYDFSPTTWLHGSINYNDVIGRATFDLKDENCKKSKLEYVYPVNEPKNFIFLVCDGEKEGFCHPIKNCNGLEAYASTIGKDKIGNGIRVSDLSPSKIETDIKKVKFERQIDMVKERIESGVENLTNLWIFALSIFISFHIIRWIYKGFRRD